MAGTTMAPDEARQAVEAETSTVIEETVAWLNQNEDAAAPLLDLIMHLMEKQHPEEVISKAVAGLLISGKLALSEEQVIRYLAHQ